MAKRKLFNSFILWGIIIVLFAIIPPAVTSSTINLNELIMNKNYSKNKPVYPAVFELSNEDENWIENKINHMSTYEKCAQMVMPWVLGNFISEDSKEYQRILHLVRDVKVGGLIFFKGDILNEATLINKMQKISDVPLLVSADFERGLAMRLIDAPDFPYNMAVAAAGDLKLAYEMGKVVSIESRALGVQQNYSPVADVNSNPANPIINIRSYSEDKDIVSKFCTAYIKGATEEKVISTAKHFPGHGNTEIDSHNDLPKINVNKYNLANNELVPFAELIKAGVQSVMVGHLSVPSLDPSGLPATLSKPIITDLLKEEMGFKGLVVTDAMNMSAITNYYSVAEATVMSVKAGIDMVLMPPDEEIAINSIYQAVENNEISIDRINESVRKILSAKRWAKIEETKISDVEKLSSIIGQESHLRLSKEIAEKSITLVKNDKKIIPIDPVKIYRTACISITDGIGDESDRIFEKQIEEKFGNVQKIFLNKKSSRKDYQRAYEIAKNSSLILLPSFVRVKAYEGTVKLSESNTEFVKKVLKLRKPSVVISFGNPYLLSLFPEASTYLCAYGDPPVSQTAMAEAIIGENKIQGKLPVTIPNTEFKIGDGIKVESSTLHFVEGDADLNYNFAHVDGAMIQAIDQKIFPGGVLLIGKKGKVIYQKAFGNFTFDKSSTLMSTDAIFDLASVSKVVGTTTAAMLLYDEGKLKLDKKVAFYLPEFGNNGKEKITVKNLLEHNSGLIAYRNYRSLYKNKEEVITSIMNEKLEYPTGSKTVYSDLNMIVLQQIIEKLSGESLDKFLAEKIFKPLKMNRTMYNPPKELYYYCPPTSDNFSSEKRNKGVVHDGNAFILGGVAGHAGLFSTASDLAIFMQMMLQNGEYGDQKYIKQSTARNWTTHQSKLSSRGIGWDTNFQKKSSAGNLFSENSFGHTGFTGTSVWADKDNDVFVILLTNRVYPDGKNSEIINFRPELHTKIMETILEKF
ncbi:MAG: glycoside hydrolase family 3 N-terminal domain-containing protein [Ignavibacteriaceae bacterium]